MKILLIEIGAGLLIIFSIFSAGRHYEKADHVEDEKAAILDAVAKRDAAHALDVRHTNEVLNNYANTVTEKDRTIAAERTRADANRMLIHVPARACPAPAGSASGTIPADGEGSTVEVELPAQVASNLRDLAEDADREVATLQAKLDSLREWIVTHGLYGK